MNGILKKGIMAVLLLLMAAFPLVAACAADEEEEGAPAPIVIGSLPDLSGVVPFQGLEANTGELDAVRYINEVLGGVRGVQLKMVTIDVKYDSALAAASYDKLVSQQNVKAIVSFIGPGVLPNKDKFVADKVVALGSANPLANLPYEGGWIFSSISFYNQTFAAAVDWFADNWTGEGKPTVGFIGTTVHSAKVIARGIETGCERNGLTFIGKFGDPRELDRTADVTALKEAGADIVFLILAESGVIKAVKDARLMGLEAVFCGLKSYATEAFAEAAGSDAEGMYCVIDTATWDQTGVEGIDFLKEWNAEWHPEVTFRSTQYVLSFMDVLLMAEAMGRAIDEVGYENLTGDDIRTAFETIEDWDPMGLMSPLTFGPDRHVGSSAVRMVEIVDGAWVSASDWIEVDELTTQEMTLSYWEGL